MICPSCIWTLWQGMCFVGTQYTEAFPTLEVTNRISLRITIQIYKIIRVAHIHLHLHHQLTANCNFSDPIMPTIKSICLTVMFKAYTIWHSLHLWPPHQPSYSACLPHWALAVPQAHKPKLCPLPGLLSGALLRISIANSSDCGLNCPLPQQSLPQFSRRLPFSPGTLFHINFFQDTNAIWNDLFMGIFMWWFYFSHWNMIAT